MNDFTLAIEINPELAQAYLNRGIAFRSDGKIEDAVADFNEFLRLHPHKDSTSNQIRNWIKKVGHTPDY